MGIEDSSLFSHKLAQYFFKRLLNVFPPISHIALQWSLSLVLTQLMKPPFEPLVTCRLALLSRKAAFLVAITSAWRVSKLAALRSDAMFLKVFNEKVILHPSLDFLPTVVAKFDLAQEIVLPLFFPSPSFKAERVLHTLDIRTGFLYYIERTRLFRIEKALLVCYWSPQKERAVSSQSLSRWVVVAICSCCKAARKPLSIEGESTLQQSAGVLSSIPQENPTH